MICWQDVRCLFGLHVWRPDHDRGFPAITCEHCGRESFYEPL